MHPSESDSHEQARPWHEPAHQLGPSTDWSPWFNGGSSAMECTVLLPPRERRRNQCVDGSPQFNRFHSFGH